MPIEEFTKEILALDKRFSVVPNPSRRATGSNKVGLNNIFFDGRNYDLPVIPDEIKDDVDPKYFYAFPNGYAPRMWTRPEVLDKLKAFLEQYKSGVLDDIYSDKDEASKD